MTTPSVGAIGFSDINTELGKTSNAAISLNDTDVRALAGPAFATPGTLITFNDLRGKTNVAFSYANFNSTTGLSLVSTDGVTSGNLYITNTTSSNVGNVWLSTAKQYNRSFSFTWNFECSGGSGADGFCLQWHTANDVNGGSGGGCGRVESTSNIHALLFATYSGAPPGLLWYKNNVSQVAKQTNAISWRQNVYYWLDYNHSAQTCNIFYSTSNSKPGSANHTFSSFVFDTGSYYLGFGAATGGATDNHILKSMSMTNG